MAPSPNSQDFTPQITLLYCVRSLADAESAKQGTISADGCQVKLVLLPCSSKMEVPQLLQLLQQGSDALILAACPQGACRFLTGNDRAQKRVDFARGLLEQVGMGADRLVLERGANRDLQSLIALAERQADLVRPLGANPLKGVNAG